MKTFFAVLRFFRVCDEQNRLSLTNIAVMASMYVLLRHPESGTVDMATFLGAVASYQAKRWMAPEQGGPDDAMASMKADIESLQTKVTALTMGSQLRR